MVICLENQSNYKLLFCFLLHICRSLSLSITKFYLCLDQIRMLATATVVLLCALRDYIFLKKKRYFINLKSKSLFRFDIFVILAKRFFCFVFWNIIEFIKFCVRFVSIYDVAKILPIQPDGWLNLWRMIEKTRKECDHFYSNSCMYFFIILVWLSWKLK